MPSVPCQADTQLAEAATAAGWPTTPSQVQDLRERRVLPQTVVTRRGRGITTSVYPDPEAALTVLLAMRRAYSDIHRHYKAVVLAWMRGARVGDGDPDSDQGLRWSLTRLLDTARFAVERKHRRAAARDDVPADRTDARLVRNAIVSSVVDSNPVRPLSEYAASVVAEPARQAVARIDPSLVPSTPQVEAHIVGLLQGRLRDGTIADLSLTAMTVAMRSAPRHLLDTARDYMIKGLSLDPESSRVDDLLSGALSACSMLVGMTVTSP